MTPRRDRDEETARRLQEVAARAARRLDILEWVILAGMAVVATAGGALVAFVLSGPAGLPFRWVWVGASVLMFGVPGAAALRRMRKEERAWREKSTIDSNHGSHV